MKIIILGAGQVGASSADVLAGEANDVTLVDIDAALLRPLQDRLDIGTDEITPSGAVRSLGMVALVLGGGSAEPST